MKVDRGLVTNLAIAAVSIALLMLVAAATGPLAESMVGLLAVVLVGLCLIAMLLTIAALWPQRSRRVRACLESSPIKSILVGLVNYVFVGAIAILFLNMEPLAVVGLILLAVLAAGSLVGLSAISESLGERLYDLRAQRTNRYSHLIAGGSTLYLAALLPFLGWFVLIPGLFVAGLGAFVLSLASRRTEPHEPVPRVVE